ncbi:hypothetical protein A9K58_04780 [Stenotrophomonas maltophilia]|uniref:RHS repeat protein n=1 Tax=Stenotrophomonas maltophilia TaxID=40324 RepID=A0A1A6Y2G7_STEMA|nr:hypothetical protein A9K58_04780 [Stenotrophomonas maltophilia]
MTNVRDSLSNTVTGLAYDVQGNLEVKNGQGYAFDHGNRLRGVDGLESYRYDAHGLRILAHVPGSGNVLSQYAHDGRLLFQSGERQGVNRDFVQLGGSLIARTCAELRWAVQRLISSSTTSLIGVSSGESNT